MRFSACLYLILSSSGLQPHHHLDIAHDYAICTHSTSTNWCCQLMFRVHFTAIAYPSTRPLPVRSCRANDKADELYVISFWCCDLRPVTEVEHIGEERYRGPYILRCTKGLRPAYYVPSRLIHDHRTGLLHETDDQAGLCLNDRDARRFIHHRSRWVTCVDSGPFLNDGEVDWNRVEQWRITEDQCITIHPME
ncbi:hypothetical protein MRB53_041755 [Persea americana]|nr:hypothetical protein MRB53_041755 [Persea americana]